MYVMKPETLNVKDSLVDKICSKFGKRPKTCTSVCYAKYFIEYDHTSIFSNTKFMLVQVYTTETDDGNTRSISSWGNGVVEFNTKEEREQGIAYMFESMKQNKARYREFIEKENGQNYNEHDLLTYKKNNKTKINKKIELKELLGDGIE